MSGNILIVDSVATNRIVLKVKLSAAFHGVTHAATLAEALGAATARRPDLVLAADLPGTGFAKLLSDLRGLPGLAQVPVVALLGQNDAETRLQRLRDGASDVIARTTPDALLLARLRSLLRHAPREDDLGLQPALAVALGFADTPVPFLAPGRIAVMGSDKASRRRAFLLRLARRGPHQVIAASLPHSGPPAMSGPAPQVILLALQEDEAEPELDIVTELRSDPETRRARLIAMIDRSDGPRAARLLDMGVHDVVGEDTPPGEIELRLAAQLRQRQARAAMRQRLQTGLEAAMTDPLTGLYNRRYALCHLARMLEESQRQPQDQPDKTGAPPAGVAVIAADLDHFKAVNDTFGHAVGDKVLMRVADLMQRALRPGDLLARMGREEFLILLPGCTRIAASGIAARLCRQLRETPLDLPCLPAPIHVTVSLGVTLVEHRPGTCLPSVETLLNQADRALYAAKSRGRDTVTFDHRPAA